MIDLNNLYTSGILFDGHYKLLKPLSTTGGSADVWLAIDTNTIDETSDESEATKVAIKIYRPKNLIDVEGEFQFRNEFKKVFNCHHINILQPTYFSIFEEAPYLVLPYCPAGSSESLIGKMNDNEDLWKYIYEVASGLAYLHERHPQIIHQDIKPANVLIDDNGNYAITDFGISAAMGSRDFKSEDESGGTFAYMAPERFDENAVPRAESDIWALGATLYEIITGDAPFGNEGGRLQQKDTPVPAIKENIPESVKKLIYSCLSYDIKSRPTARQIVDTVLKKRYTRNKRTIIMVTLILMFLILGILAIFFNRSVSDQPTQYNIYCERGDSILAVELKDIQKYENKVLTNSITGLNSAMDLFHQALNNDDLDKEEKERLEKKIFLIGNLKKAIASHDSVGTLASYALDCDMEEEYVENSIKQKQYKEQINSIIHKIKSE